ncbi:MAG TPA: amino acid adenylation domain-containing protein, partial [Ktedonobacteraceae bacterium]
KIRGYRIEPAEIETTLLHHPNVQGAAVVARERPQPPILTKPETGAEREDPEQHLIAYIVPTQQHTLDSNVLRSYISAHLPTYMLPSAFVFLQALPVSPAGKLDRQKLPAPDWSRPALAAAFSAPGNQFEETLSEIWSRILGIAPIGIHDNFFELGGHSLAATRLLAEVRHTLHCELTLHSLFASPTIAQLAALIEQGSVAEPSPSPLALPRRAGNSHFPLSFSQERVWFIQQLDPGSLAYNTQTLHRLSGTLDVAALQRSLQEIVRRHEIFRTTFPEVEGRPVQIIHPALAVTIPLVDLQWLDKDASATRAQRLVHEEFRRPFAIDRLPLIRWTLLRLAADEHVLILVEHHLVHDGWSANVLLSETLTLYEAFSAGKPSPLPELSLQFADFAAWQRQWMQGDVAKAQLAYWQQKLRESPPSIALPTDRPHASQQSFRGATLRTVLPPHIAAGLRALSRHEGVTLFMTMFSAFLILLYRYSGQADLSVGTAIANRRWPETEGLIGMIINNIVLRTHMTGNPTFRELLRRVYAVTTEAYANQDLPFDQVVNAVQPERDAIRNPLFQIMFSFHDPPMPDLHRSHLMVGLDEGMSNGFVKFDLDLLVIPRAEQYLGKRPHTDTAECMLVWEYNTDLYDGSTVARMQEHYELLLSDILAHPQRPISALQILPPAEEQHVLHTWNATQHAFAEDMGIHQLFERQVAQTPDAIAVLFEDAFLTYFALNARANQIAHILRTRGVQPEHIVGLYLDRSLEQVSGMLGILKAGGAYLPLDPDAPPERLAFLLRNAHVSVLLTVLPLQESIPTDYCGQRLYLDEAAPWQQEPSHNELAQPHPLNLAYVIYTSGSAGQPKGVLVSQRGLCNHMHWMQTTYPLNRTDRVLQKTPFSFDASVWEFYAPLLAGACLVMARPGGHQDLAYLVRTVAREQITILQLVPAVLANLLLEPEIGACTSLRYVFCGGEELSNAVQTRFFATLAADLCNLYGPTETTIQAVTWTCERASEQRRVPIGRPIFNTQVYLLDTHLQAVPVGAVGELYIGGAGVARGYLHQPALTAEHFCPDPFSSSGGERLYRSGDTGRYRADGALEFLGRTDEQAKLRGLRIEPGEVEHILKRHLAVREAVVRVSQSDQAHSRLVAYVVPAQAKSAPGIPELRAYLLHYLPDSMVPSSFIYLEDLPRLPNGKLDQHALLAHTPPQAGTAHEYRAPQTAVEETLARIWSEILGVERVGTQDTFFELGGHSLLMMSINSRIRTIFNVELPLRDLYTAHTIAALAALLSTYETTPGQLKRIAELHKKIAALPASEVRKLLQAKQQGIEG